MTIGNMAIPAVNFIWFNVKITFSVHLQVKRQLFDRYHNFEVSFYVLRFNYQWHILQYIFLFDLI